MIIGLQNIVAYDSATVADTALTLLTIGFTQAQIDDARQAFISIDTDDVRVRYDGTAPIASEGHLFVAGENFTLVGINQLNNFQVIRATGVSGAIRVTLEN